MPQGVLTFGCLLSSLIREVREVAYQIQIDRVVDWGKYRDAFGGEPTPIGQAMRETLAWYRQHFGDEITGEKKTP